MRLSEQAYHLIKEQIVTLQLEPLSVIDEQALREDLGLGRTPIREALHRLAAEGLVIIAPRRGMFVADISITDLAKIFEVRMVLEGFCARLAAQRITADQIARLEETMSRLDTMDETDSMLLMEIDEQFHEMLYAASNNEFLADTLNRFHALSLRLWHLVLDRLPDFRYSIEQHREITQAIKERDGARAEQLLQQHVTEFQQEIKAAL